MKEIHIDGCIRLPKTVTHDEFLDHFIEWVEQNQWTFGGATQEVDAKGEPILHD